LAASRSIPGHKRSAWFVIIGITFWAILSAVFFKTGHHGARTSNSKIFLDCIKPQYVIISAGEGNSYGHPHEETLERFDDVGAAVLRTDEEGKIEVTSDGQQMWWEAKD